MQRLEGAINTYQSEDSCPTTPTNKKQKTVWDKKGATSFGQ